MNSLAKMIRQRLRRAGWDIVRHFALPKMLQARGVSVVVDVGANIGQFGSELREFGYRGRIISFEPVSSAFRRLKARAAADGQWEAVQIGLGAADEEVEIHVSAASDFNSILPAKTGLPADVHTQHSRAREKIQVRRLDSIARQYWEKGEPCFLIDTQGFERAVLAGATETLQELVGVQMELSLTTLYEGQAPMEEMLQQMRAAGFVPWGLNRGFGDPVTGRIFEMDAVFFRPPVGEQV